MSTWTQLAYLVVAACFILALKGLSGPRTARRGNLVGAAGALLALLVVLAGGQRHLLAIVVALALGAAAGALAARRVPMTAMPQLVALFNGVGGAAAALVALAEVLDGGVSGGLARTATVLTLLVGAVSFSGSLLTFAKLQELMTTRPVVLPAAPLVGALTLAAALAVAWLAVLTGGITPLVALAALALVLGVLMVLPVGGADVPIVISLLNAFTGLSVAASGYVLGSTLLLVSGTLVGASGTLLTRLMAQAMGRSTLRILFGAFLAAPTGEAAAQGDRAVRSASPEDVAVLLGYARRVVVVPGYGLAVAQAQHVVRELAELLEARGAEVVYGIHPVAGRMPGHMNVLLAEANVPYEQLREMEQVNATLPSTDVALVVGANDVVNPAARAAAGSPIAGMPIIDVDQAQHVVFLKRSLRPGFAGVDNPLLYDPRTTLVFGDAKETLTALVAAVGAL
ncbi:MAG: NAD(P)(+) transhydrogenase (Re/Si-specific) subunit beta [Actinomycetota bacterium]